MRTTRMDGGLGGAVTATPMNVPLVVLTTMAADSAWLIDSAAGTLYERIVDVTVEVLSNVYPEMARVMSGMLTELPTAKARFTL